MRAAPTFARVMLCVASLGAAGLPGVAGARQAPSPGEAVQPAADELAAAPRISVDELRALRDRVRGVLVVDVRSSAVGATIDGAASVPLARLAEWGADTPRDAQIVCYCACRAESLSAAAVLRLRSLGFTNARALRGGLQAWIERGLPVAPAAG